MTRERVSRDWKLYAAIAAVTALYLAIRLPMGIGGDYLGAPTRYFFKQMIVVAFGTLAAPWRDPSSMYERWQAFIAVSLVVLLLVHGCVTWGRSDDRAHRAVRLALWVLAAIAPVFTLFFVGPTLEGSRYLYLASCAWSLLLADLIATASRAPLNRRPRVSRIVAVIVLVFAVSVQRELGVWRQAADLRDHVLADARTALDRSGMCARGVYERARLGERCICLPKWIPGSPRRRGDGPRGGIARVHVHLGRRPLFAVEVSSHLSSLSISLLPVRRVSRGEKSCDSW